MNISNISFDQWKKLQLKVGKIIKVEKIPNRDKLYKLQVDLGEKKPRQIITGLVPYYKPADLLGKLIIVLANLKPAKFAGEISEGMLLCAEKEDSSSCVLLTVEKEIDPGTPVT